jgi:putative ABC transport system permease protein
MSLTSLKLDLALAARMLIRHAALSAVAVLGITVAIAITVTMFTIVGEQLNPSELPLPGGDRIVALQKWDPARNEQRPLVPADVVAWRERLATVRDIGAFRTVTKNLIVPPAVPEPIDIAEMSAAGFDVAGIAPALGRAIRQEDERAGAEPVVVIGYSEWLRRFGGDPDVLNTDVLNSTVQLGGTRYTVVGVMPEGFAFPIQHAYWVPLRLDAISVTGNGAAPLSVFGRLAPGATLQSAQVEVTAVGDPARVAAPDATPTGEALRPRVMSYARQFSELEDPDNALGLQMGLFFVTILLIVISINIAVLVYARTAARQSEIAVRTALGASRGRIVAQLFVEGLVLAVLGAAAGLMFAPVALRQILEVLPQEQPLPFWMRFDISAQTMASVVALTVVVAAIIGAIPAWKATGPRVQNRLRTLSAGGGGGMHLGRAWTALIIMQVAFAVALLPMVVVRMSELASEGTAPGFAADEYLVARLSLEAETGSVFARRYREIEQRIADTGTVRAITFSSFAPGAEWTGLMRSETGAPDVPAGVNRVSVNFFDTFGVPILTGRNFTSADAAPQGRAMIVNRAFANAMVNGASTGANALGSRIRPVTDAGGVQAFTGLTDGWYEIVGIVDDFPESNSDVAPEPNVYLAIAPEAAQTLTIALHLRAADAQPWGTRLQRMAADLDPALQVTNVALMGDVLRENQRTQRLLAAVLGVMTISVLLLSAAGIYAMMAFSVNQRRREIGIRLALGAGGRRILWTMFSRASVQLLTGAALGTAVIVLGDRAADGALMSGQAVLATSAVVLLITITGLLAALGPARQGLRIEPTEALRD